MDRITILTPVHIATGNEVEMPCYHKVNDITVNRYRFTDVLSQLPPKVMTDSRLLDELSSRQPSKKLLYRYIHQYVDYSKLTPLYNLEYTYDGSLSKARNDVSEQMHDLHKPFIPGSTIKGTLLNSWKYYLLKLNYDQIRPNISKQIKGGQNKNLDFHELMFGKSLDNDHANFYKELYSCFLDDCSNDENNFIVDVNNKIEKISNKVDENKELDGDFEKKFLILCSLVNMSNMYRRMSEKLIDEFFAEQE